jgi:hypothetical protein
MSPIKMRDTLRKKATKAESIADDVTSVSGDSVSINSWVEAQSVQNNESISSKTSRRGATKC